MLEVFENDKLIAAYPVAIGSARNASPVGDWKVRGIAILVTLAALYTHYSAFFILAAENVWVAVEWLSRRRADRPGLMRAWLPVQVATLDRDTFQSLAAGSPTLKETMDRIAKSHLQENVAARSGGSPHV